MSVKYSLALMSTKPGDDTAKKMYYAKAQADGVVTMDEMAEEISYATSLTDGERAPCSDSPDEGTVGSRQNRKDGELRYVPDSGMQHWHGNQEGIHSQQYHSCAYPVSSGQDGEGSHTFGGVEFHESDRKERNHSS